MRTVPALAVPILLGLAACREAGPPKPAAPTSTTPDSVRVRLTPMQMEQLGRTPADSLAVLRLVPCPGGSGAHGEDIVIPGGGFVANEAGDTLVIQAGSIGKPTTFTVTDVADARHRVVRTGPLELITLPATVRVNFARCPNIDPGTLTLVRLRPDGRGDDVGGRVAGTVISAPVGTLGDFALATR